LANSKSSLKRIRVAERRRIRNKPFRSAAKTYVKRAEGSIATGERDAAVAAVSSAVAVLDRVASKGVIHKNNAARRKSRLMAKLNKLASAGVA